MEISENFREWRREFSDYGGELLEFYEEACHNVPAWLETNYHDICGFREELAAHIRDSSYGPLPSETQWGTDEVLRDLWFDVFGAEAPPGDPYPVSRERWGRYRMSTYLGGLPGEDNPQIPDSTRRWMADRGVTFDDLAAYRAPGADVEYSRPEPPGYRKRLAELTEAGHRSGPVEGEHADRARADLLDAKQSYLATGRTDQAAAVDRILADREPRDG